MTLRSRLRLSVLLLGSGLTLGACAYDDGYGYGGVSARYGGGYGSGWCDPYFDDCYGAAYDPWFGWYDGYYYPGWGYYVYDRYRRPYAWNDYQRRYWESRRYHWRDRDWNDPRWERWDHWDDRDWRRDRRWRGRDGDRRRWRDRRRGDWNGGAGPATAGGDAAPRSSGEAFQRESGRDWSGARSGARESGARSSGRAWRGSEADRDPE
jgi:hypothetical protein